MHNHTTTNDVRRNLVRGLATGLLCSQLALTGFAQTSDAQTTDTNKDKDVTILPEFRVTGGFRGSLQAATEAKQASPVITEMIAAEDIGKLPDVSIADSLTRLTGVTTQRTNGRSQAVSIRGLGPDFSVATLNGREQVSTGLNRGVEFDQYPGELLSGVELQKTSEASVVAQGLAGTIELQTVRPLDKGKRTIALNSFYEFTQLGQLTPGAKRTGERVTLSYVDQFDGGKLGVAFGLAYSSKPFEGEQFQAWGYPTDSGGNYVLGGTKSYVRTSNLTRTGVMGVIEWRPNSNIHSIIDIYRSKFEEKQLLRGAEIPLWWSGAHFQPGYTISDGLATLGTYTNVQPVVRNDIVKRNDDLTSIGWNLKIGDGTGWTTIFDVGYSSVKRKDQNLETYSGLGFAGGAAHPDTVTVKLIPGQIPVLTPTVDYTNASLFKLTDPQGWGTGTLPVTGMEGYLKYFQSKDELGQFKLSTKHEMNNIFSEFEAGVSYTDRFKRDGERPTGFIYNASGASTAPLPPIIGTTDISFLGLGHIYAYDPLAAYNNGLYTFFPNPNGDVVANRWKVTEKLTRPYVEFKIDQKWGGVPVVGNLGLAVIHADQQSSGLSATGSGGSLVTTPVTGGATYNDWAPSLNLNFKFTDQTLLRFGMARQIARPRMFDMKAGRTFNYNSTYAGSTDLSHSPWSGDGGNPALRPWRANSVDLSLEHYFKQGGYVSIAAFYKRLLTYIYQQTLLQDFTGYPIQGGSSPVLNQGPISAPANGSGGSIKGFEGTIQLPSELISKEFKGFGVIFGGAVTDSDVQPWGPGNGSAPLAGLAKKVANATIYYEHKGFSVRLSERFRSATREYITTFGAPNFKGDVTPGNGFSLAQPEKVMDAQISYELQDTSLKGLTFYLQAYNLNNEPLITYNNGDPRQVINYQKYGASYSAGVSYKF